MVFGGFISNTKMDCLLTICLAFAKIIIINKAVNFSSQTANKSETLLFITHKWFILEMQTTDSTNWIQSQIKKIELNWFIK